MPPAGRRPTAFEVSFPEEAAVAARELQEAEAAEARNAAQAAKRKNTNDAAQVNPVRARKRSRSLHALKPCKYVPRKAEIKETEDLVIDGEDQRGDDDERTIRIDDKPVRTLSLFAFLDPENDLEMTLLSALEDNDPEVEDRTIEGAGFVAPLLLNEEDDGQREDVRTQQYIRLTGVMRYLIDYTKQDEPVYVETAHAFYALQSPSQEYKPFFQAFYRPHRVAQVVLTMAISFPNLEREGFSRKMAVAARDHLLQQRINDDDIEDAVQVIKNAVEEHEDGDDLLKAPFLAHILRNVLPNPAPARRRQKPRRFNMYLTGLNNIDLKVLRPENQTRTCLTPLIQSLASPYFQDFDVLGPKLPPPNPKLLQKQSRQAFTRLQTLMENCWKSRRTVSFTRDQRLSPRSNWLRSVSIDEEQYEIGDCVVIPIGQYGTRKAPDVPHPDRIPADGTIDKYFWFAKIIYISEEHETAHMQWFWHSTSTAIEDVSDHQELFLSDLCDTVKLQAVVGKVTVHYLDPGAETNTEVQHDEFFYRFAYDSFLATYTDVDHARLDAAQANLPPNNCCVCLMVQQRDQELHPERLPTGISYIGMDFHIYDFALLRSDDGPCKIGHIISIELPGRSRHTSPIVTVKLLGRMSQLDSNVVPQNLVKDERHLFLTDEQERVRIEDLLRVCYIFPRASIPDRDVDLWVSLSPDHFYAQYRFPSTNVKSWGDRRLLHHDIDVCIECCRKEVSRLHSMKAFIRFGQRAPLRALDLFGGVGTLGHGLVECQFTTVTHAVEISPSACKTLQRNSPETVVYNNCANVVLRYAVKTHERHELEVPKDIRGIKPLPAPPVPGEIDIILAGFPCQSHSSLNMYQKADDRKSSLILTTLSWIDFMKPKLCVLENVRGFLNFNLLARQVSKHKVEGGIEMGGLKLVVRALIAMNYQVRFGLLQAGHYGLPQSRVRFFLIAAKSGFPLPELPQPSHDFPITDALAIKLPIGEIIRPIRTATGTAPHPFVTVGDAIGDLARFDWKNPGQNRESAEKKREARERAKDIPTFSCNSKLSPFSGYKGVVRYQHEPKTTYQLRSRKKDTTDLQHYTRSLLPSKVERVCNIPLRPKADFRSMRPDLFEWQLTNPASAVAKGGFRGTWYGRLDKDGWFSTTVTNVEPTAKQSRVLHPDCKRMVTVRELARSQGFPDHFVFESVNDNVVTLHRQIGNAVPWLVAVAIGKEIRKSLFDEWLRKRAEEEEE